jgi:hypothetical protein
MEPMDSTNAKTPLMRAGSAPIYGVERRCFMSLLMLFVLLIVVLVRKRRSKLKIEIDL